MAEAICGFGREFRCSPWVCRRRGHVDAATDSGMGAKLKALGSKGDPKTFADLTGQPMGAVVSLGGCTASFVSPDGLIVTNHHCVAGGLQYDSTPARNLLKDGFLAKTREEELSNGPGSRVFVTTSVAEVTSAITGNIDPKTTDRERYGLIEHRIKERVAACEKGGRRCNVAFFFGGLKYFEIAQMEIKDVRLVYAPADGIGVFGGETDNWRWPRHTGDWGFLRAYVGKDGTPAAFSKDNVPYRPKHWLKIARKGQAGDLVFVAGYPGRTQRHQTYEQVKETTDWAMPRSIRLAQEQLAILEQLSKQDKAIAIKVARAHSGLEQWSDEPEGRTGRTGEGGQPQQESPGKGTRGLDRRRPGAPEKVWRCSSRAAHAAGGKPEDAGAEFGDGTLTARRVT